MDKEFLSEIDGKVWRVHVYSSIPKGGKYLKVENVFLVFKPPRYRGKSIQVLVRKDVKDLLSEYARKELISTSSLLRKVLLQEEVKKEEIPDLLRKEKELWGEERISARLKPQEYELLLKRSKEIGVSISQYVRFVLAKRFNL